MIAARTGAQILPVYLGMKNHTWKFLRPVKVIVGKPIPFESFHYDPEKPGESARIAAEVYDAICRLGEENK